MRYLVPSSLGEALAMRRATGYRWLAGGTDLYPAIEVGLEVPGVIDVTRIADLAGAVRRDGDDWLIPALATWTQVQEAELPAQFDVLKQAAAEVGGRQIQNTGTVAGNLCNASPAADGVAALLALDARVAIAGAGGARSVPLADFVQGNRRTALAADEIVTAVRVPACAGPHASLFRKLGGRRYLVISVAMTGVLLACDAQGALRRAGVAVGACGPRPVRLATLESRLLQTPLAALPQVRVRDEELAVLSPIDDVRGSAAYRLHAARTLVEESLHACAQALGG